MKSGVTPKSIALWFVAVILIYVVIFNAIEYMRRQGGPWIVTFISDATGSPSIVVNQESLEIANVQITFLGTNAPESNINQQIVFDVPKKEYPFGTRIHEDLIYLPGVQNFHFFGHQVELFSRTLRIDGEEIPWKSDHTITLHPLTNVTEPRP